MDLLKKTRKLFFLPVVIAMLAAISGCSHWSTQTTKALSLAKENRGELEKVLTHYKTAGDEQKLAAAEFLIANMPGHGYVIAMFCDKDGNEVAFDATDYDNFDQALAALEKLEAEHGELDTKRKDFIKDIETITADYLIENIDLAFETWRQNPWAKGLSFEAFCEHILPYRCSNEPINRWRKACIERYKDLPETMDDPTDIKKASQRISKDVHSRVKFRKLYYLHPTDQGFDEMEQSGAGRCEDISNMISYAQRASGVAVASDYTPAWANRDNNHAWNALLDSEGRGKAPLGNIAAKVYRKTFSTQHNAVVLRKKKKESVPRWLSGKTFVDVTDQYIDACDITLELTQSRPGNVSFAYLCVFNGGRWAPICSGDLDGDRVLFEKLGPGVVYLPIYYHDKQIHPAASPFVLTAEGAVRHLEGVGSNQRTVRVEITTLKPATDDDDTRIEIPQIVVKPDKTYEMFYWDDEWQSLGTQTTDKESVSFDNLPANRLYWMVEEGSKKLERIFTIENGQRRFW